MLLWLCELVFNFRLDMPWLTASERDLEKATGWNGSNLTLARLDHACNYVDRWILDLPAAPSHALKLAALGLERVSWEGKSKRLRVSSPEHAVICLLNR